MIRCERGPVSEEWSESGGCTLAWPYFQPPPAPPCMPTDEGDPEEPLRSRSSPVRKNLEDEVMPPRRTRSPSASRRAALRTHDVHASPDQFPMYGRQSRQARHSMRYQPLSYISCSGGTSFGCRSSVARVSAYYSVRPPAVPLKLVAVASTPPPTQPPTLPGLPTCSSTTTPPLLSNAAALVSQLDDERCKNAVRSVLCELLTALPLSTSSSPIRYTHAPHVSYATHDPQTARPMRPAPRVPPESPTRAQQSPTLRATYPTILAETDGHYHCQISPKDTAWSVRSVGSVGSIYSAATNERVVRQYPGHHVATQAQTAAAAGNVQSDNSVQEQADSPDEWLGGVRALRDSHVRLVLRQLRHIERLNRALDRAARGSPGSPTSYAVHAATSTNKPTHKQALR